MWVFLVVPGLCIVCAVVSVLGARIATNEAKKARMNNPYRPVLMKDAIQ